MIVTKLNPESILILIIILGILPGPGDGGGRKKARGISGRGRGDVEEGKYWTSLQLFIVGSIGTIANQVEGGSEFLNFVHESSSTRFGQFKDKVVSDIPLGQVKYTPLCQYPLFFN